MKKNIILLILSASFAIVCLLSGCQSNLGTLLSNVNTHCKKEIAVTPNGNFVACLLCDSTTGRALDSLFRYVEINPRRDAIKDTIGQ